MTAEAARDPALPGGAHNYAQTNLQLYRQLAEQGYQTLEVAGIARVYDLGLRLFPATYRGSGKSFLSHLVGCASILGTLQARMPVIACGLLHAAYTHGEFGNGWQGISNPKRAQVREAIGEEIEDLVARYTALRWEVRTIPAIRARLGTMSPVEREVLLVRLANELEDHLDLGILYCADVERRLQFMQADLPAAVEMAELLGFPSLAKSLTAAFEEVSRAEVNLSLRRTEDESFQLPLASHRLRLRVALSHLVARCLRSRSRPR